MWVAFLALILALILVDLFLLNRQGDHVVSLKESLGWTVVWVALALAFNVWLWWYLDGSQGRDVADQRALEFLTGYLIEKSLALDNIFVFLLLFNHFAVPAPYQHRVLIYGVLGAIIMRIVMILAGAWLIVKFHWILYIFGAFLFITGVKMFIVAEHVPDLSKNPILRWMRQHLRITGEYHGEKFFVMRDGLRHATPLFLVLVLIEVTDLVFAVDSIPAIFAITEDPFIVFTSNIFAILGLRSLYFLLADVAGRFRLLKYGLALVLVFVGTKMLVVEWIKIPAQVSLAVIATILAASVALSWRRSAADGPS